VVQENHHWLMNWYVVFSDFQKTIGLISVDPSNVKQVVLTWDRIRMNAINNPRVYMRSFSHSIELGFI
jgi:putative protein kinase ArgK-like GTPase of G3E family